MNAEPNQPIITTEGEPTATTATVPMWLIALMLVLLFLGAWYFDLRGGWFNEKIYAPYTSVSYLETYQPVAEGPPGMANGKKLYEATCALCHNLDGSGKAGQAPPLAGSEWVISSRPDRAIAVPQAGLTGPIQVKGQQWNLSMPAMGAAFSDQDLADLVTYIRGSWGNQASPVTAEQVKAIRDSLGNRTQPFTAPELLNLPE